MLMPMHTGKNLKRFILEFFIYLKVNLNISGNATTPFSFAHRSLSDELPIPSTSRFSLNGIAKRF